jgi:hypothetical protein
MPGKPRTFREIIDLWPMKAKMATQLNVSRGQIDDWYRRNRIPPKYWMTIMESIKRFGYKLNGDDMLAIHAESGCKDPVHRTREREREEELASAG